MIRFETLQTSSYTPIEQTIAIAVIGLIAFYFFVFLANLIFEKLKYHRRYTPPAILLLALLTLGLINPFTKLCNNVQKVDAKVQVELPEDKKDLAEHNVNLKKIGNFIYFKKTYNQTEIDKQDGDIEELIVNDIQELLQQ